MSQSPMRGVGFIQQNAQTTGNGTTLALPASFKHHSIIIEGSAGVSAGAIQPEVSETIDYAGTWAPLGGGPITVVASTKVVYNFEGVFRFFRARISTTVVDGTVTVTYVGGP